jgi:hypothetical protein
LVSLAFIFCKAGLLRVFDLPNGVIIYET